MKGTYWVTHLECHVYVLHRRDRLGDFSLVHPQLAKPRSTTPEIATSLLATSIFLSTTHLHLPSIPLSLLMLRLQLRLQTRLQPQFRTIRPLWWTSHMTTFFPRLSMATTYSTLRQLKPLPSLLDRFATPTPMSSTFSQFTITNLPLRVSQCHSPLPSSSYTPLELLPPAGVCTPATGRRCLLP